ncbi:Glutathione S-transferase 1 [Trichoplax sp. H2]|uniref:glutathione transferase n=1 Tax=Trichoplax adhaerens TaxID=10228 RepID=B3S7A4_TRIAD|nr:hypothetical protein TRIADDRAFT_30435 [Trichoplax adhaerens]EDV21531.1 hypothetical protein TRIADDRAFT_30435 [Trichoplax adhaerens]RDD39642.1 Glutathione S-transferase 1 [Trichoplax sp. H2]|eukprot:XP_002116131.1 hypothetical protein TRIADDRAFT_30435 [Trichoplax adhaerens]
MTHIRLIYFNVELRAELIRLILAHGEIEFEDVRFEKEDWPRIKEQNDFLFGQVPILEVDGVQIAQSSAIVRYVARMAGLAGKDSLEQAKADMLADAFCNDILEKFYRIAFFERNEEKKTRLECEFRDCIMPDFLDRLERFYIRDGGDFLLGDQLTYADLAFYRMINLCKRYLRCSHPKLRDLYHKVSSLPNIAKWEQSKPKTRF